MAVRKAYQNLRVGEEVVHIEFDPGAAVALWAVLSGLRPKDGYADSDSDLRDCHAALEDALRKWGR